MVSIIEESGCERAGDGEEDEPVPRWQFGTKPWKTFVTLASVYYRADIQYPSCEIPDYPPSWQA